MGVVASKKTDLVYNKYYLYRHIRVDKNEPFYIGVGTKRIWPTDYGRAYTRTKRNSIWMSIASKTEIRVEIVFESDNKDEVWNKEKEFIALYGRIKFATGTLANLSAGGEGNERLIFKTERRKIQSQVRKKISEVTREKMSNSQSKPIFQYAIDGSFIKKWKNAESAERELKLSSGFISAVLTRNKVNVGAGYVWYRNFQGELLKEVPKFRSGPKAVLAYDLDYNLVQEFRSERQAVNVLFGDPLLSSCIRYTLLDDSRTYRGYRFRYKKDIK
jgi:hypothetical protein